MKEAGIAIRFDPEFREQCDSLFGELGMTASAAFSIFLRQAVRDRRMPFTPDTGKRSIDDLPDMIAERTCGQIRKLGASG